MQRYIHEAYSKCETILKENLESLHAVAGYLLKHETMDGEIFNRIMAGDDIAQIEADEEEKAKAHAELERQRREEAARRLAEEEALRAQKAREEAEKPQAPLPPWMPPIDNGTRKD